MIDLRIVRRCYIPGDEGLPIEDFGAVNEDHENLELHEVIDILRREGLEFESGTTWASNPDGSTCIDFDTNEHEEAVAFVYLAHDWELAAIIAGVNHRTCEGCHPSRTHEGMPTWHG